MQKTKYEVHFENAENFKRKGAREEALIEYDNATNIRPQYWLAHYSKGEVLLSQNESLKAGLSFANASTFCRGRSEPALMAARAFYNANFFPEAMHYFEQVSLDNFDELSIAIYLDTLSSSSRYEDALNILNSVPLLDKLPLFLKGAIKTYEGIGDFENSQIMVHKLIELMPNESFGYGFLASSLLKEGKLSESILMSKKAISHSLSNFALRKANNSKLVEITDISFDVSLAEETLQNIVSVLEGANIPHCLLCGTLLGFYRDGGVLPYDKDLDIGILPGTSIEEIEKAFDDNREFRLYLNPENKTMLHANKTMLHAVITSNYSDITADFFFLQDCGKNFNFGFGNPAMDCLWEHKKFSVVKKIFNNREFYVPDDINLNLNEMYGAEWRNPDPNFDSVLMSPNRVKKCDELSIAYGYKRLENKIGDCSFEKAAWYIDVLKNKTNDNWLVDIELEVQSLS